MTAALADVTVRMLHVEQNQQISGFWNDIARRYEAAHPGVKVDVQYLENEAYKKKLTTLLQSSDRPNIIYSWGGGVLRDQVKAGVIEDLTPVMDAGLEGPLRSGGGPGLHHRRQDLRRADAHLPGRLLLQQGSLREGRCRRIRDQDLG